MDLVGSGGGGNSNNVAVGVGVGGIGIGGVVTTNVGGSLGSENGPILYSEPNRTSAIDDIRSVVIYIFIITIFLSFFLILPGIRYEKFPTFLCITTSLIVTSIILVTLFGTSWHVGEAPISAAYKAFSRDRIQGDLSVRIGLQSVNITLQAHKYYILHATHGPIIMDNSPIPSSSSILQQMASSLSSSSSSSQPPTTTTPTTTAATNTQSRSSFSKITSEKEDNNNNNNSKFSSSSFLDNDNDNDYSLASTSKDRTANFNTSPANNLAEELLGGRTSDGATVDTELEVEEVFANSKSRETSPASSLSSSSQQKQRRTARSSLSNETKTSTNGQIKKRSTETDKQQISNRTRATTASTNTTTNTSKLPTSGKQQNINTSSSSSSSSSFSSPPQSSSSSGQKYTIKRVNVDINYNERFYWIEPNQMRQEHHNALERGLPYPILTVVEYLSQDAAGFSWSRQYRLAGYYSYITLWLSLCVCILMFFLHCAAPKYGIYTMQILGCLLLFTNFTYATLVPRGEQKLVIPFEGQSLTFDFGWNFWLVLFGGCLSLTVGTLIVIIDYIFPNFIFTTVLDVDFDSHNKYYKHRMRRKSILNEQRISNSGSSSSQIDQRQVKPPFFHDSSTSTTTSSSSSSSLSLASNSKTNSPQSSIASSSTKRSQLQLQLHVQQQQQQQPYNSETKTAQLRAVVATSKQQHQHSTSSARNRLPLKVTNNDVVEGGTSHLDELFVNQSKQLVLTSDSEFVIPTNKIHMRRGRDSSVVEILDHNNDEDREDITTGDSVVTSDTCQQNRWHKQDTTNNTTTATNRGKQHHHYSHNNRNKNVSTTDHLSRRQVVIPSDDSGDDHDVRL